MSTFTTFKSPNGFILTPLLSSLFNFGVPRSYRFSGPLTFATSTPSRKHSWDAPRVSLCLIKRPRQRSAPATAPCLLNSHTRQGPSILGVLTQTWPWSLSGSRSVKWEICLSPYLELSLSPPLSLSCYCLFLFVGCVSSVLSLSLSLPLHPPSHSLYLSLSLPLSVSLLISRSLAFLLLSRSLCGVGILHQVGAFSLSSLSWVVTLGDGMNKYEGKTPVVRRTSQHLFVFINWDRYLGN